MRSSTLPRECMQRVKLKRRFEMCVKRMPYVCDFSEFPDSSIDSLHSNAGNDFISVEKKYIYTVYAHTHQFRFYNINWHTCFGWWLNSLDSTKFLVKNTQFNYKFCSLLSIFTTAVNCAQTKTLSQILDDDTSFFFRFIFINVDKNAVVCSLVK